MRETIGAASNVPADAIDHIPAASNAPSMLVPQTMTAENAGIVGATPASHQQFTGSVAQGQVEVGLAATKPIDHVTHSGNGQLDRVKPAKWTADLGKRSLDAGSKPNFGAARQTHRRLLFR